MRGTIRKISATLSIAIGAVLFLAALAKATQPADTLQSLQWALGQNLGVYGLVLLIIVELGVGALLMTLAMPKWAFAAAVALFLSFVIWIGTLELVDAPVGCGCGVRFSWSKPLLGVGDREAALFRASGLMLACCFGLVGSCLSPRAEAGSRPAKAETM